MLHDTIGGGDYYLIFGVKTYYIGRLNPDMISFAEKPKPVTIHNSIGSNGPGKTGDKPFLHIYNSTYYLSWGGFYATGQSPYGPFTFRGSVISTSTIAPDFRMNDTNPDPSAWWAAEDQADRHGSFFTLHGQWYFACNDRSHSSDEAHPGVYRDPILAYVHYLSNGSIAPIVIDRHGGGWW